MAALPPTPENSSYAPEVPHARSRYRDSLHPFDDAEWSFGVPTHHWSRIRETAPPPPDPDPREAPPANRTPRVIRVPSPAPRKPE